MTTYSSILAWDILQTEEPGRLQSMGSQESDTTQQLNSENLLKKLVPLSCRILHSLDLAECILRVLFKCSCFLGLLSNAIQISRSRQVLFFCENMLQVVVLLVGMWRWIRRVRGYQPDPSVMNFFRGLPHAIATLLHYPHSSQGTCCDFYYWPLPTMDSLSLYTPAQISLNLFLPKFSSYVRASIKSHFFPRPFLVPSS